MVFAHVIYKKTGQERRNVTLKAYNLLKSKYTFLGYVDENGNPVKNPDQRMVVVATKTQKKTVVPAVSEPKKLTPEEIESKKEEMKAMNEAAIKKIQEQQEQSVDAVTEEEVKEVKERKKQKTNG